MRYSIFMALSLLVSVCASQTPSGDQTFLSSSAAALIASPPDVAVAEESGSSEAKMPARIQQVDSAPEGAEENAAIESDEQITNVRVVPMDEADDRRICEYRKRPGSRIAQKVCFTRQERIANQEATKDQLANLQREQRWRDEIIREAQMNGRRPSGFGLGPD